jgi:hypothetical protein
MKNETSTHWDVIKTMGLKTKDHDMEKLFFLNEKMGFFLGSEWVFEDAKNNTIASNQNATINKSNDGGINWKVETLGKGVFFHFQKISQNTICASKKVYSGLGSGKFEYIETFYSDDLGTNWTSKFKTKLEFISLMFLDSVNGIGISRKEGVMNNSIYITKDGGANWNELKSASNYYFNESIEIKDSKIYLLGSNENNNNDYNLLFEIDVNSDKTKIEKIPVGSLDHIYIDSSGKFWLIKDGNKVVEVYLKNKNNIFELFKKIESTNEIFLDQIYSHNNVVNLVLSETLSQGNQYSFLRTDNLGKSWSDENLPLKMMAKPSSYYGDNCIWMYGGGNRFQIRR